MYINDIYAPAVVELMARELSTLTILRDSDKRRIEALTAETEAQAEEIKRLQGEFAATHAKQVALAHQFKVGDRVVHRNGNHGSVIQTGENGILFLVTFDEKHPASAMWCHVSVLAADSSDAPDASLPTV